MINMGFIQGDEREQLMLPISLDDMVEKENPVRIINAFVESIDLEKLHFTSARPARTGRPAYAAADLLKLYIYGYQNTIRSSRKLEREAGRNMELMWLLKKLKPDHKFRIFHPFCVIYILMRFPVLSTVSSS